MMEGHVHMGAPTKIRLLVLHTIRINVSKAGYLTQSVGYRQPDQMESIEKAILNRL